MTSDFLIFHAKQHVGARLPGMSSEEANAKVVTGAQLQLAGAGNQKRDCVLLYRCSVKTLLGIAIVTPSPRAPLREKLRKNNEQTRQLAKDPPVTTAGEERTLVGITHI